MTIHQLPCDDQHEGTPSPGKLPKPDLFEQVCDLLMQERCYLNPNLKMEQICLRFQTYPTVLLKSLKKNGFRNFPHFVNHHRVEAVKTMMAQEEFHLYTLEAIAEMAGFGTRQAFYNTFERLTGMKPACYRRMVHWGNPPCTGVPVWTPPS